MPVVDPLTGHDGQALAKRWANRREAYLGTTVAGYPTYFMLVAPNTVSGHTSVWTEGGCRSWYLDPDGNTSVLWPGYTGRFGKALQRFEPADYEIAS